MKWFVALALTLSLLACGNEPPEQTAAREAITQCRQKQADAKLSPMDLDQLREQCDRMQANYQAKWGH